MLAPGRGSRKNRWGVIERDKTESVRGSAMVMSQSRRQRVLREHADRYSCGTRKAPCPHGEEGTGAPRPLLGAARLAVCPSVYLLILLMLPFALEEGFGMI